MSALDGEKRTGSQSYQVIGVGQHSRFIEIVDAPDQPAFDISPRTEILDMKIAYGEHVRRFRQVGTDLRPDLHPAIKSGPQERKCRLGHALMLQAEIRFHNRRVRSEPGLISASCLDDIHRG